MLDHRPYPSPGGAGWCVAYTSDAVGTPTPVCDGIASIHDAKHLAARLNAEQQAQHDAAMAAARAPLDRPIPAEFYEQD